MASRKGYGHRALAERPAPMGQGTGASRAMMAMFPNEDHVNLKRRCLLENKTQAKPTHAADVKPPEQT